MACTVLSALVSLYIQAAKTDNQPHGLWIVQRTNTLKKKIPHISIKYFSMEKLDTEIAVTFL